MAPESGAARALASSLADMLAAGGEVDEEAAATLFAQLVRAYGRRVRDAIDAGVTEFPPPYPAEAELSASDVLFTAGEMIRAAGIGAFELGVWNY
jgi:hypothetical protein